jgi:tRNA(fMet)-specific endonuclease VapC
LIYLLDTNVCIPLINRSDSALRARLLEHTPDEVGLCSVVKAELLFGARGSKRVAENLDRVERFCSAFESLPFDDDAAAQYGSIRALLAREGRLIGANDLLIAATALARGVKLVTRNREEFSRVPTLEIEVW